MAVDTLDINQIAVILSQLIQNYNELAQNWFDVFYNPEQMDVTLKFLTQMATYKHTHCQTELKISDML